MKIKMTLFSLSASLLTFMPLSVLAQGGLDQNDQDRVLKKAIPNDFPRVAADETALQSALSAVFLVTGSLSVLFVVIGGAKYVLAQDDAQRVQQAKETVLYAIIGLVVSLSAFAIVRFVLGKL